MSQGSIVEKPAKLRFNCFLLRDEYSADPVQAFRSHCRPLFTKSGKLKPGEQRGRMLPLRTTSEAPTDAQAYFMQSSEKQPVWAEVLSRIFVELEDVRSSSKKLVIFLPVSRPSGVRIFAICFGYGSTALEWASIEPNFGLRVASRVMSPDEMKELRSLRVDGGARRQQIQMGRESRFDELDVAIDGEFVSKLVGRMSAPTDDGNSAEAGKSIPFNGALIASASIGFDLEADLESVRSMLAKFLEVVEDSEARPAFAFVDALEPLRNADPALPVLESALVHALAPGQQRTPHPEIDRVEAVLQAVMIPEELSDVDVGYVGFIRNGDQLEGRHSVEEVASVFPNLLNHFSRSDLRGIRVSAFDFDGSQVGLVTPLLSWLIFEAKYEAARYILSLGKWFRIKDDFVAGLERDLLRLEDLTAKLNFPAWRPNKKDKKGILRYHESVYNATFKCPDWLIYDSPSLETKLVSDGDEIEACDLFHSKGYLVHVKRWSGSATASHLLSQGAVSAEALRLDEKYKEQFIERAKGCCSVHSKIAKSVPDRVVYAFGGPSSVKIPESLPTFTKVNLRSYANRIRIATGNWPAIAKIDMI